MTRFLAAAVFVIAATATAHAQAPGDYYSGDSGEGPISAPGMVPVQPAPAPAPAYACAGDAPVHVMANRWAVGLAMGHLSLAPKDQPDNKTEFGTGELSVRLRATPHIEIEGDFGGGRQQLKDGSPGDLEARIGVISARYVFNPYSHWNLSLMGGLGSIQVAQHGATDQDFKNSERPMGQLGVGLERRWQQFAIRADLRAVTVGPNQNQQNPPAPQPVPVNSTSTNPMPGGTTTTTTMDDHVGGGMFTIGAAYYF